MNFIIYPSMSTQAVWIMSLTSLPLVTTFLKHSCNLSSVKGDPHLQKKKTDKQTVTEQQNCNLMSPASPGRIHQNIGHYTSDSYKNPNKCWHKLWVKGTKWPEWIDNKTEMDGHKGHAKYISYSANGFRRTLQDYR